MRLAVLTLLLSLALAAPASAGELRRYAQDTWRSFDHLVDARTGLPSDNASPDGARAAYTSPTNIAAYLWSTVAARDLHLISKHEARRRLAQTLSSVAQLERDPDHGQFFNWYDPATGARLTTWPADGSHIYPFISTVDNGWLAAALIVVARAEPSLRREAEVIRQDFGLFYDPASGHLYGGAWTEQPPGCSQARDGLFFTCHRYDTLNTEPRIASYVGIAQGSIPPEHYYRQIRAFGPGCDWSWTETQPVGTTRTYRGVDVFEGAYPYRGMQIVPSWGGSMFEALMVPLLVPEEQWGPRSWGVNHPLYARAQIEHGLDEARYGYWGFSPSDNPSGGYREYGVDAIGMNADGYASNNDNTLVDHGFGDCRPPKPDPTSYANGVVTPHASFLALDFAPRAARENLARLRRDFAVYGPAGFFDAVNVQTGEVARHWLALDQGMIMAALGNALTHDRLQGYLAPSLEPAVRPLLAAEEFSAR